MASLHEATGGLSPNSHRVHPARCIALMLAEHSTRLQGLLAGCMHILVREACSTHDCHAKAACWAAAMGSGETAQSCRQAAEFPAVPCGLYSQHENKGQRIGSGVKILQCAPELPSVAAVDYSLMLSQQGE